jgi:hypothetical protein
MNKPNRSQQTTAAKYEIRIRGYLDECWSDRLGGMTILPSDDEHGGTITTLYGQLPDQAALFGVLNALYDMRLPVLSFECLDAS